jgi:Rieske Fe-S protein
MRNDPAGSTVEQAVARRAALVAIGAAGLAAAAGCATYSDNPGNSGGATTAPPPAGDSGAGDSGAGETGGGGTALAATGDIPVGGGKVFTDEQVVVTQPAGGTFAAFSAVCTHQGCTVAEVTDGTIDCPCHGSKFKIADGAVSSGPATQPLPKKTITVAAGKITLG